MTPILALVFPSNSTTCSPSTADPTVVEFDRTTLKFIFYNFRPLAYHADQSGEITDGPSPIVFS